MLLTHGGKLFFCAEAGVSIALFYQFLGVDVINLRPLALPVGTISAHVPIHGSTFVKGDAIVLQGVDQHFHSSGNLPFGVGILHPEEQDAAGLVGHTL